jgi:adenylylsulfate kinase-like enzyme
MYKFYWFTGQAGAGKTELANALKQQLNREQTILQQNLVPKDIRIGNNFTNQKFVIIDGDDIREIYQNTDYSLEGRKKNVDFVQKLCLFLIKNDIVPIVCMVSPFKEQRSQFVKENNGVEIYVYCSEIRGRENFHVDYYEKPIIDEKYAYEIDTTGKSVNESFNQIAKQLVWKNI